MCTVSINIDEAKLRSIHPELDGTEAISRWLQDKVDLWMHQHTPAKSVQGYAVDAERLSDEEFVRQFLATPYENPMTADEKKKLLREKDKSATLDQFYGVWSDGQIDADAFIAELKSARTFKRETIE